MDGALQEAFEYYLAHQEELVAKYAGKYIVIVGKTVVGTYDSEFEAISESRKTYEPGTFLVQKVEPGDTGYTQTFHSRVAFH